MDFQYEQRSIKGPGSEDDDFEYNLEGCECNGECGSENGCKCLSFGTDNYDLNGQLIFDEDSNLPIMECHPNCSCFAECRNRSAQFSLQFRVEPFQTDDKGLGLRALEAIKKSTFLIEYSGEIISQEEAVKRALQRSIDDQQQNNYIFTINEFTGNSGQCTRTFIDATNYGNLSRLINHSCEPNLFPMILRYGRVLPVLALFTKCDINEGEEFSYDYGKISTIINSNSNNLKPCKCGSMECRGFLPSYDYSEV